MTEALTSVDVAGRLLVGHDGSAFAEHALEWTLGLAARLGATVTVLRAWVLTTAPRPTSWSPGYVPPLADFAAAVADELKADTTAIRAGHADVEVTCHAVHGAAAKGLIEASATAELLVVGSRGNGGFKGLVLGSVSEQCVRHAACPVVVVRTPTTTTASGRSVVLDAGVSDDVLPTDMPQSSRDTGSPATSPST